MAKIRSFGHPLRLTCHICCLNKALVFSQSPWLNRLMKVEVEDLYYSAIIGVDDDDSPRGVQRVLSVVPEVHVLGEKDHAILSRLSKH